MRHEASELDRLTERDIMGRRRDRYRKIQISQSLPLEAIMSGLSLVSLEADGDPVVLETRDGLILAWWDEIPSLTEVIEMSKEVCRGK